MIHLISKNLKIFVLFRAIDVDKYVWSIFTTRGHTCFYKQTCIILGSTLQLKLIFGRGLRQG